MQVIFLYLRARRVHIALPMVVGALTGIRVAQHLSLIHI